MTTKTKKIIENDEFNIYQDTKKSNLYTIEFSQKSKILIQSLIKTKILLGSFPSDDYTSLFINANSIQTLKQYQNQLKSINNTRKLNYNTLLQFVKTLSKQIKYLINFEYKSFYAFNTENIIVINESIFIYLSNELLNIHPNTETIEIIYPFPKNLNSFYISPELYKMDTIPSSIHYKTIYYSLSALAIDQIHENDFENDDKIKNLESLKNTKLYFLLLRCLDEDIKNRSILFI